MLNMAAKTAQERSYMSRTKRRNGRSAVAGQQYDHNLPSKNCQRNAFPDIPFHTY